LNSTEKIALITPPFTQLSSPYPAVPFLSGTLDHYGIKNTAIDLSQETAIKFFSKKGLTSLFDEIEKGIKKNIIRKSSYLNKIIKNKHDYIDMIDPVIKFLQGKNDPLSYRIMTRDLLPEGKRFEILDYFEFDGFAIVDGARYIATLFIDDIFDIAVSTVVPYFGLNSYGPRLERALPEFKTIKKIIGENDLITRIMTKILSTYDFSKTDLVAITIPFPGNLLSSLKISQWLKRHFPEIKIAAGGGYVNTELGHIQEKGIFDYFDYICFDDGELPLIKIIESLDGKDESDLVRTMKRHEGKIVFIDKSNTNPAIATSVPGYANLGLDSYITLKETTNPMHNLWSEKGFLKLRFAKGCYHHKCAFCDTGLDYINCYMPVGIDEIIMQITALIDQTGISSFHFVDEAMPPSSVRKFCLEIIRRKINITWWGNIRFERNFDGKLCKLMAQAGCIAVTGGLETANNRLLKLMEKGVTVEQAIKICDNFSYARILVHAYLIAGFPTETAGDAVNSLEIIRQMFKNNVINSAYYHRFALTVHSPIFRNPEKYSIRIKLTKMNTFANNDVEYSESNQSGIDAIESGLNKAVFNYNAGLCLDDDVNSWFKMNFDIDVPEDFVSGVLADHNPK
jgi:radical SAM superfamily enzyme YgiQ (UPF0313 family)